MTKSIITKYLLLGALFLSVLPLTVEAAVHTHSKKKHKVVHTKSKTVKKTAHNGKSKKKTVALTSKRKRN